ncbi:Cdc6/Cdc18 family protein [Haloarcula onubensis]|uniref:ORC1-type DNA replication protein n=1 Tax=Haloarcula onubensis TaxID=2950539 RepID=A0ABU2FQJ6_9EURY|nr:ORC1-type DNA replication protein [Halomicroarcula sp. S3CR25-11]MDS0282572.1 ORC1-type DNA replication protein [Halomicroarcula sp. S3CR25-11]
MTDANDDPEAAIDPDEDAGDSTALGSTADPAPDLDDVVLDNLETSTDDDSDEASRGLFDDLLEGEPIFENKEVLRPSYTPHKLPHREEQINNMATILVTALRGDTPSNILIYGKTGTGKTASAKFVSEELETTSQKYEVPCEVEYINCEVTDTQYRVLAQLANKFIDKNVDVIDERIDELEQLQSSAREDPSELADSDYDSLGAVEDAIDDLEAEKDEFEEVPMTGWPTDRVYSSFFDAVDYHERVVVIMLDEIDKLVEKSGDDTLYNLSRMNSELENSRVSIMGISNDLKFTDFLDPRVKSSLGEEEIVFPPYDANQLRDILQARADVAFKGNALTDDVIPLCAAFAAQEHGDARRALDLLRTAGELAERDQTDDVEEDHVRQAQEKIELDRVVEVVRTLPTQSKIVLFAIILLEKNGVHNINTGEVFNIYKNLCAEIDADVLTQRRVTDLISELDMLGIVNAVVVSKGRYGRTKEISLSVPTEETEAVLLSDSRLGDIDDVQPFVQARFDN